MAEIVAFPFSSRKRSKLVPRHQCKSCQRWFNNAKGGFSAAHHVFPAAGEYPACDCQRRTGGS